MSARIVSFLRRANSRDWTSQELAEFYRVESALIQAGLRVCSDRGVTDEGDPWFVFCQADDDDGDVIVHFARIGGQYLISAPSHGSDVRGYNFRELVRSLVERHPALRTLRRDDNVTFHPSALLVVLVASALLKTAHTAEAASVRSNEPLLTGPDRPPVRIGGGIPEHAAGTISQDTQESATILAAIAFATSSVSELSVPVIVAPATESLAFVHAAPPSISTLESSLDARLGGSGSVVYVSPHLPLLPTDAAAPMHDFASLPVHTTSISFGVAVPGDQGATAADLVASSTPPLPAVLSVAWHPGQAVSDGVHAGIQDVAVSLLSALGGNMPTVYAGSLPVDLVIPLHNSVHTATADVAARSPGLVTAPTIITTVPESHLSMGVPTTTTASTEPAVVVTHALNTPPPGVAALGLPTVVSIMQSFAQEVGSHLAVLATGNQVIEYDYFAVDHTPAAVSAVTYDFTDGSHLSLVGLPSEILHAQM